MAIGQYDPPSPLTANPREDVARGAVNNPARRPLPGSSKSRSTCESEGASRMLRTNGAHFGQHWGICGAPSAPITLGRYSSWPNALSFHPAPPPATHSHRSEGVRPRATLNREVATSRQTARAARRTPGNCVSKDWRCLRALVGGWYHARPPSPAAPQSPPLTTALELVGSPNRPGHLKRVKGRRQLGIMPRARARHTSRRAVDHQWLALLVEGNLPQLQVRLRRGATATHRHDAPQCLGCRRKRVPRLGTRVPRAVRSPRNCHRWSRHASRTWSFGQQSTHDRRLLQTTRNARKFEMAVAWNDTRRG